MVACCIRPVVDTGTATMPIRMFVNPEFGSAQCDMVAYEYPGLIVIPG